MSDGPPDSTTEAGPTSSGWRAAASKHASLVWAARLLLVYGVLVVLVSAAGLLRGSSEGTSLTFSVLHLAVLFGLTEVLLRFRRWAWWLTAALTVAELFILAPLAGGVLFGPASAVGVDLGTAALWVVGSALLVTIVVLLIRSYRSFFGYR
jgi:hypothetical protein